MLGAEESNLRKITAKFPGKLRRRSSLLFQIQERDRAKRLGSYYASVEKLSTSNGRLWGYDRRPKGDVGKRSAERKRETESSAACVLGIIFQQTRNKIP